MKKIIIILIAVLVLIVAGIFGFKYYNAYINKISEQFNAIYYVANVDNNNDSSLRTTIKIENNSSDAVFAYYSEDGTNYEALSISDGNVPEYIQPNKSYDFSSVYECDNSEEKQELLEELKNKEITIKICKTDGVATYGRAVYIEAEYSDDEAVETSYSDEEIIDAALSYLNLDNDDKDDFDVLTVEKFENTDTELLEVFQYAYLVHFAKTDENYEVTVVLNAEDLSFIDLIPQSGWNN